MTTQVTPPLHTCFLLHKAIPSNVSVYPERGCYGCIKDVGIGLLVYSFFAPSYSHNAIPTPSFYGFWYCHPYTFFVCFVGTIVY